MALRCLIVDDSEDFLAAASRLLTDQGLEVVGAATSGAEAARLVQTFEPNVALVDVQLGNEDGLEVARQLARDSRQTRIILISTHAENELAELIDASPAVGFVPKYALSAEAIADLLP